MTYYRGYDPDIILVSAKTGEGLEELGKTLSGRLSILIGSSGVGKTSILNGMYPGLDLRTTEVSESTGKGRHTTTNVEMFSMDGGTRIIDTPGLREFGLMDIEPEELGDILHGIRHVQRASAASAPAPMTTSRTAR